MIRRQIGCSCDRKLFIDRKSALGCIVESFSNYKTNLVIHQANPRRVKVESRGDTIVSLLYAGKSKSKEK